MSKILLVDTNFSSIPIFNELLKLGHEVHVVGANPRDCLAKISSNYWNIDYSDLSKLDNLIINNKFDFIVPGCTDRSYASCVAINNLKNKFLGLDSIENEIYINNKSFYRNMTEKLNLSTPKLQENILEQLRWPLIVKPVDSFSGKGISIVYAPDKLKLELAISQAKRFSPSEKYLIEDFIEGNLYSHSAFILNKKITVDFFVEEYGSVNKFVVDTSRVVTNLPESLQYELRNSVEKIARELRLSDGLFHTQFILRDNSIFLIESTRRCPGDLYSQLIEKSTGFPYTRYYLSFFIGLRMNILPNSVKNNFIIRHTLTTNKEQYLSPINFYLDIKIDEFIPLSIIGDRIHPSPKNRAGIMFIKSNDFNEDNLIFKSFINRSVYSF